MRISNKRIALGTGLAALTLAAAPLVTSLGPAAHAACTTDNSKTAGYYAAGDGTTGGVYLSSAPGSSTSTSGYVGAGGPNPATGDWGYAEAGGSVPPGSDSYVVTSNGGYENGAQC